MVYEAVGPGGSAFIIETLTDKKSRTVSDLKQILGKHQAQLAESGSQAWQFKRLGVITSVITPAQSEQAQLDAIESGADDVVQDAQDATRLTLLCPPQQMVSVRDAMRKRAYSTDDGALEYRVTRKIELSGPDREKAEEILELLEAHDDVHKIAVNF